MLPFKRWNQEGSGEVFPLGEVFPAGQRKDTHDAVEQATEGPPPSIPTLVDSMRLPSMSEVMQEIKEVHKSVLSLQAMQTNRSGTSNGSFLNASEDDLRRVVDDAFTKARFFREATEFGVNGRWNMEAEKVVRERIRDQIGRDPIGDQNRAIGDGKCSSEMRSEIKDIVRDAVQDAVQDALRDAVNEMRSSVERAVDPGVQQAHSPDSFQESLDGALRESESRVLAAVHTLNEMISDIKTQGARWTRTPQRSKFFTEHTKENVPEADLQQQQISPVARVFDEHVQPQPSANDPNATEIQQSSSSFMQGPLDSMEAVKTAVKEHGMSQAAFNDIMAKQQSKQATNKCLSRLTSTRRFKVVMALCAFGNMLFLGWFQAEAVGEGLEHHGAKVEWGYSGVPAVVFLPDDNTTVFDFKESPFRRLHPMEIVGTSVFTVVSAMHFFANPYNFVFGSDGGYNILDAIVCLVSCLDMITCALMGHPNCRFGPNLTFLLVFHVMHEIMELTQSSIFGFIRLMLSASVNSIGVVWSVLALIFIICYCIGIVLMHGIHIYLTGQPPGSVPEDELQQIGETYGTTFITVLGLSMVISGGKDWGIALRPLGKLNAIYTILLVIFIGFSIFGILNVVTGLFVDFALKVTAKNKTERVRKELSQQEEWEKLIKDMFKEADRDGSGTLSWQEFQHYMEHPVITAYFQSLELDISEAKGLFRLLDVEGDGHLSGEEFVKGCSQLKGEAKSLDLASLRSEFLRFARHNHEHFSNVHSALEKHSVTISKLFEEEEESPKE